MGTTDHGPDGIEAAKLLRASFASTALFGALSVLTYVFADSFDLVFAVVSAVLFAAGTFLLGLGIWNGIQRSRVDEVTLTGLLSVDSSHVPAKARNRLWLAVLLQTVIAVLFGSLRPFTEQAFGLLVPILGLGFAALWGSRFAVFHPRDDP